MNFITLDFKPNNIEFAAQNQSSKKEKPLKSILKSSVPFLVNNQDSVNKEALKNKKISWAEFTLLKEIEEAEEMAVESGIKMNDVTPHFPPITHSRKHVIYSSVDKIAEVQVLDKLESEEAMLSLEAVNKLFNRLIEKQEYFFKIHYPVTFQEEVEQRIQGYKDLIFDIRIQDLYANVHAKLDQIEKSSLKQHLELPEGFNYQNLNNLPEVKLLQKKVLSLEELKTGFNNLVKLRATVFSCFKDHKFQKAIKPYINTYRTKIVEFYWKSQSQAIQKELDDIHNAKKNLAAISRQFYSSN